MTSLVKKIKMISYALRIFSVERRFAIPNLNTYGDVTDRIVGL